VRTRRNSRTRSWARATREHNFQLSAHMQNLRTHPRDIKRLESGWKAYWRANRRLRNIASR